MVNKFLYLTKDKPVNPLAYLFFLATFAYGLGFVFFRWSSSAALSSLYVAMGGIHGSITLIWGGLAIVTIAGVSVTLWRQVGRVPELSGMLGVLIWLFASTCYVMGGYYLVVFSVGLPNTLFWVWYFMVMSYIRRNGVDNDRHGVLG